MADSPSIMTQKKLAFIILLLLTAIFVISPTQAKKKPAFFDAQKTLSDRDFVLNDSLEFALFDMSEIKLVNDSRKIKVVNTKKNTKSKDSKDVKNIISALKETQDKLEKLPSYFYKSLDSQILKQMVPVTLFPDNSPSYTKPLQLYIKVKRIHLKPNFLSDDGLTYIQPFHMYIYGQIADKKSKEVLIKFYDSAKCSFKLKHNKVINCFKDTSNQLMQDLALYLRTKY